MERCEDKDMSGMRYERRNGKKDVMSVEGPKYKALVSVTEPPNGGMVWRGCQLFVVRVSKSL